MEVQVARRASAATWRIKKLLLSSPNDTRHRHNSFNPIPTVSCINTNSHCPTSLIFSPSTAHLSPPAEIPCARARMAARPTTDPAVLTHLDRLDMMLLYLEEMRGSRPASGASTTSTGTAASFSSPKSKSLSKRRRPIDDAVAEAQLKGTIIVRVSHLESRLLKLEEEMESEKKREEEEGRSSEVGEKKRHHGKGLKRMVKSCVKGDDLKREE